MNDWNKGDVLLFGIIIGLILASAIFIILDSDNDKNIISGRNFIYGQATYQCKMTNELKESE